MRSTIRSWQPRVSLCSGGVPAQRTTRVKSYMTPRRRGRSVDAAVTPSSRGRDAPVTLGSAQLSTRDRAQPTRRNAADVRSAPPVIRRGKQQWRNGVRAPPRDGPPARPRAGARPSRSKAWTSRFAPKRIGPRIRSSSRISSESWRSWPGTARSRASPTRASSKRSAGWPTIRSRSSSTTARSASRRRSWRRISAPCARCSGTTTSPPCTQTRETSRACDGGPGR